MAAVKWKPATRKYEKEKEGKTLAKVETTGHPLKAITVTMSETSLPKFSRGNTVTSGNKVSSDLLDPLTNALEGCDPLSQLAAQAELADPLSRMAGLSLSNKGKDEKDAGFGTLESDLDATFEPWSSKKSAILSKYTTSEKLSLTTSFLSGSDKDKVILKAAATSVSDKVRNRLEQLDDFEEGSVKEMLNLSQQDYVNRIDELNNQLKIAWDQDQRVKALKIAIQCAKLLADVSVIQFYPSKFVFITDILDTFGKLVFDRIKSKAQYIPLGSTTPVSLPDNFNPGQVPETAKETCRNWFYKIASIRELVPRFYVEVAILKCYSFLTSGEYNQALRRLSYLTRGIGDPLVAIYARCYLCRVGIKVAPSIRNHVMSCFDDFLQTYFQIQGDSVQNILAVQKVELSRYLTLYSPALDWILQCLAHNSEEKILVSVLDKAKSKCNSALLLNSIMSAFKPEYISKRSTEFIKLIKDCEETGFPKYLLYKSLGACLVMADPPENQKLNVLNEVWKVIMKMKNPEEYITCAEVWIEYIVKNFSAKEVNTVLGDIIKHLTPDRAYANFYPQLQSVITKVLAHIHDFSILFAMERFLPFVDMFQKDSVKVEVCKTITEAYIRNQTEVTNDPIIMNAFMFICKTMHDSVNALSLDDEIRIIGGLIIGFIRSISFGRDFEQQLSFCVEARALFSNIDLILMFLVQSVNRLAVETRYIVKGNHSSKTASFVRACAAYCFITIPSLNAVFARLNLYLLSGKVALLNNCLSQGDAFFRAAISMLHEIPKTIVVEGKMRSTEPLLLEFMNNFTSCLLVVPDNPEQDVLYLVRGMLNVINEYPWDPNSDNKFHIYLSVLVMLSAMSQEKFLYHIDKVESNDTLYGMENKFLNEISKISSTLLSQITTHVLSLDKPEYSKRQANLCLEVFNKVTSTGDIKDEAIYNLSLTMWNAAQKQGQLDTKLMVRSHDYVKRKGCQIGGNHFAQLGKNMFLQTRT